MRKQDVVSTEFQAKAKVKGKGGVPAVSHYRRLPHIESYHTSDATATLYYDLDLAISTVWLRL